jgi:hypothetical protein
LTGELGDCPLDEFVAALHAEGLPIDRGFRGFVGRPSRRCRKVGDLTHSRRAAETTIVLHHPILLESDDRIDAAARGLAKVATEFSGGGGMK